MSGSMARRPVVASTLSAGPAAAADGAPASGKARAWTGSARPVPATSSAAAASAAFAVMRMVFSSTATRHGSATPRPRGGVRAYGRPGPWHRTGGALRPDGGGKYLTSWERSHGVHMFSDPGSTVNLPDQRSGEPSATGAPGALVLDEGELRPDRLARRVAGLGAPAVGERVDQQQAPARRGGGRGEEAARTGGRSPRESATSIRRVAGAVGPTAVTRCSRSRKSRPGRRPCSAAFAASSATSRAAVCDASAAAASPTPPVGGSPPAAPGARRIWSS